MGAATKSEKTAAQPTTATVTRTEEDEGTMNMYENSDFIEKRAARAQRGDQGADLPLPAKSHGGKLWEAPGEGG